MAEYKAWTYKTGGYPSGLSLTTQPVQETPLSPTQLQIRVKAAALNPVDIQLMNLPLWSLPYLSSTPKGVGMDFSGVVLRAGSQADGFATGDEVFGLHMAPGKPGTLAEVLVADTARDTILHKPARWSWTQAAALPLVWLTARTCIARVEPHVPAGGTLAVLGGSSATGMYVVHLARQRGWNVVASCSGRNVDFVRGIGAGTVVDYTSASVPDAVRAARPDAIVDCVGGTECLGIARRYVTIVGDKTSRMSMGGSAIYWWNPQMLWRWFAGWAGFGEVYDCIILDGKKEYLQESVELPTDKIVVDSVFAFGEAMQAFERLNTSRARGKVVVEVEKT